MSEEFSRKRLAECCRLLYERRLTVSAGGNMSVRLDEDTVLITPSGVNKGRVSPEDMVKMSMGGRAVSGGKPSIEHKLHLGLYRENPETNAVVHCHPLYCLAVMTRGGGLRTCVTPEGVLLLDRVPVARYETPGSDALVDAVMEHAGSPAILMDRHGAVTQGRTLEEAFDRMEELEFQAHLQLLSPDAEDLPADEIERLRGMRRHGDTRHQMVRILPRRREIQQDNRQAPDAARPRRLRREARAHAEGRDPPRGEGARRREGEAGRRRPQAGGNREAGDVRFLVHQGRGLRLRPGLHARSDAAPGRAQNIRADSPR